MSTLAVAFRGDRTYIKALKALAYQKGMTMGDLVRQAVDELCGDELKPHLAFFYAQDGHKNVQSGCSKVQSRQPKSSKE